MAPVNSIICSGNNCTSAVDATGLQCVSCYTQLCGMCYNNEDYVGISRQSQFDLPEQLIQNLQRYTCGDCVRELIKLAIKFERLVLLRTLNYNEAINMNNIIYIYDNIVNITLGGEEYLDDIIDICTQLFNHFLNIIDVIDNENVEMQLPEAGEIEESDIEEDIDARVFPIIN